MVSNENRGLRVRGAKQAEYVEIINIKSNGKREARERECEWELRMWGRRKKREKEARQEERAVERQKVYI